MELITPHFEIWQQGNNITDIWDHVARCTRVCYQSTPKEIGETSEEFVKRVILRNITNGDLNWDKIHGAMLEHGTVYLELVVDYNDRNYLDIENKYESNKYSKVTYDGALAYITTNLRVIYENGWLDDLKYICEPTEYHARRVTVSFTTNVGVTREFNRHRDDSIAEESTRYCDYTAGRLQKCNKFALPAWFLDEEHLPYIESHQFDKLSSYLSDIWEKDDNTLLNEWCDMDFYLAALTFAEWFYQMLRKKGWKPQQAREVLPLATKSQLIHTAFIDDWKHFFALRAEGVSGPPHPNAALLAKPLMEKFKELNYV